MKRDLNQLARHEYDVLVIGSGIYGACVAWDASLRGLSVALVDQGDFGHATSANSLKIIHGGLRYLQDFKPRLVRAMARERMIWMRIAPHLVHPLPCVMPTYDSGALYNKFIMAGAIVINDLLCWDRNRHNCSDKYLPGGAILPREECLRRLPGLAPDGVTGGVLWYDAQAYNTERLLLSIVLGAVEAGAVAANYVQVTDFLQSGNTITGVRARDTLTGQTLEIRAKLVVNCAGAWVDAVLRPLRGIQPAPRLHLSAAINLVTRQLHPEYAFGIPSAYTVKGSSGRLEQRKRTLFIVPWRRYSLIGTLHTPFDGQPQEPCVAAETIEAFREEINRAYPGAQLTAQDVYHVHYGFLPAQPKAHPGGQVSLLREGHIYDHEREEGIGGLITVVGVKYTVARHLAQKVVDLIALKLQRSLGRCTTFETPVFGGDIESFGDFLLQAIKCRPEGMAAGMIARFVYNYGSKYLELVASVRKYREAHIAEAEGSSITKAEVTRAVREESALKLVDLVRRRADIGAAGLPDMATLERCADIMAAELAWDPFRRKQELQEVQSSYIVCAT